MATQCPHCNQTTLAEQLFCPHCGGALYPERERLLIQSTRAKKAGRWTDAISLLDQSQAQTNSSDDAAEILVEMGTIYRDQLDDLEAAIERFQSAYSQASEKTVSFGHLDELLKQTGRVDERKSLHKNRMDWVDHETVLEAAQELLAIYGEDYQSIFEIISPCLDRFPAHHGFRLQVALIAEQADNRPFALSQYQTLLEMTPNDPDLLRAMRRVYLSRQNYDAAWCLCRTLFTLDAANRDETMFYHQYAAQTPTRANNELHNAHWYIIDHPYLNGPINELFAYVSENLVECLGVKQRSVGIKAKRDQLNLAEGRELTTIINYLFETLPIPTMEVYRSDRTALLRPALTQPPCLLVADPIPMTDPFSLMFKAARRLAQIRPAQIIASTYGDATERYQSMQLLLTTLLRLGDQEHPDAVYDSKLLGRLQKNLNQSQKERVTSLAGRIVDEGCRIDEWLAGVELTADRIGFLLTNHLEPCLEEIKDQSSGVNLIAPADRIDSLRQFSVSEGYLQVRRIIGHNID